MIKGLVIALACVFVSACAQNVPAIGTDSTMEVATWNVEWFGDLNYGPSNDTKQFDNVVDVFKKSKIDVWGLQEIADKTAWDSLLSNLSNEYNGVLSTWSQTQKTGLIYNKDKFTFIYQKHILALYQYEFASGRLPLEVALEYKHDNRIDTCYFFVLHMKANTGSNSDKALALNRRKTAADGLRSYLNDNYKGKLFFVIGDWNDDLDKSIYNNQTSPFRQFANDTSNFFFASEILTDAGEQSTVYYPNMIDHICASKNTKNGFISDMDVDVFRLDNYISSYGSSTSDHYPVYCKFYPSKWHSKNSSSLQLISNSPDIFWDGRNLVVPFKHKELKYFNMQGQTLKSDGLPSNQLIVYQLNSGNKRYTGKFVINQ